MLDAPITLRSLAEDAPDSGAAPRNSAPLLSLLERHFGYRSFRPLQEEIIHDALAGRDVLAILPTGAGKSLCFQLPAVARPGLSVVVSPLIALMKDQVDSLTIAGISATFLSSMLEPDETRRRTRGLSEGRYSLLYVAPERLLLPGFLAWLRALDVRFIAVDEAHCISQWGHDFRPEYRRISDLRRLFPEAPVMALSATATDRVRADILSSLRLRDPKCYVASFDRPNLHYRVEPRDRGLSRLVALCQKHAGEAGIVYTHSRRSAEKIATMLRREHVNAAPYHAGLEHSRRAQTQEAFRRDAVRVICATVAFGMGVNKPDVRFVAHHDLPGDIESYYQETGRAGRDGLPAEVVLYFAPGDAVKQARLIEQKSDESERSRAHHKLAEMVSFAESGACRRRALLAYFGEAREDRPCGACDNCLSPREAYDGTTDAQKLMSCVLRIQQSSGISMGLTHVAAVLCGAESEKIRRFGHERLSTYGVGKGKTRAEWLAIGRELCRLGLLRMADRDGFQVLVVTPAGRESLSRRSPVELTRPHVAPRSRVVSASSLELKADPEGATIRTPHAAPSNMPLPAPSGGVNDNASPPGGAVFDEALFGRLRKLRRTLADARDVPAYVIFGDVSLREMATTRPTDLESFRRVKGVGDKRLADFGPAFLKEIGDHLESVGGA